MIGAEQERVAWRVHWPSVLTLLGMAAFLSAFALGLARRSWERGPLWAQAGSLGDLALLSLLGGGYVLCWLMSLSQLGLTAWRATQASPALVAGTRGLRLYGVAPRARLFQWLEVEGLRVQGRSFVLLELSSRLPKPVRVLLLSFAPATTVYAPGRARELADTLERLRQAAHTGPAAGMPYPEAPREDPA